ncbi:MAG: hypothetical protein HUK20_01850 [Fibrobacter sp.]|nr:hypothetical protein [Fibrobacter sp.]
MPENTTSPSFLDNVYDQIESVIGGNNPNQFLCLQIPGTVLEKDDYEYDTKTNIKSRMVEANESRLANKMFDPCRITSADNGRTLPYQYKTALDVLTPKLNASIAEQKNKLRRLLMTNYPYDFGKGLVTNLTLQEVYFKLYDEYLNEVEKWAKTQEKKKKELQELYTRTECIEVKGEKQERRILDSEKYNEAYLTWYDETADIELLKIDKKKGNVLAVFSPNDMKILEGVLDSGCGAELQQARETLNRIRKTLPNGGYVYPVNLKPDNWFKMLKTSFTENDLRRSTADIAIDIASCNKNKEKRKNAIIEIARLWDEDDSEVKKAYDAYQEKASEKKIITPNNDNKTESNLILEKKTIIAAEPIKLNIDSQPLKLAELEKITSTSQKLPTLRTQLLGQLKLTLKPIKIRTLNDYYQDLINALDNSLKNQDNKNRSIQNLLSLYESLKNDIKKIDDNLEKLNNEFQSSMLFEQLRDDNENGSGTSLNDADDFHDISDLTDPESNDGFTQITFSCKSDDLDSECNLSSSKSTYTKGRNLIFMNRFGYAATEEENKNVFVDKSDFEIQISMKVGKVSFERDWFNPGIFSLTGDMYRLSKENIAPSNNSYKGITKARLNDMSSCIFPCFPVAMLVAKDMVIKFKYNKSIEESVYEKYRKHAISGGNFLLFRGSNEINSKEFKSNVHISRTSNTISLKFDSAQLIGYYLEATAADNSEFYQNAENQNKNTAEHASISTFVDSYVHVIDEMNKKLEESIMRANRMKLGLVEDETSPSTDSIPEAESNSDPRPEIIIPPEGETIAVENPKPENPYKQDASGFHYYLGRSKQNNLRQIHKESCICKPNVKNRDWLGQFKSDYDAINFAKFELGDNVDGCAKCCPSIDRKGI